MPPKVKAKAKGAQPKALFRKNSEVHAFDPSGAPFKNFNVWCHDVGPAKGDKQAMFVKGLILPGSTPDVLQCQGLDKDGNNTTFECPMDQAYNCNSGITENELHDIGMLPYQNVPAVLDYLAARYTTGNIYATADPLQIAINPFKNVGTGGDDSILRIRDDPNPENVEPHTFTTTRAALENAWAVNKPQTIIVSGESGAGKTEAVKMAMRYCAAAKSGLTDTRIQNAILGANPVLEAFGNAKTIRNDNSSRFGRYMQLAVGKAGGISAGSVKNFLLEKSRVISQESAERNYHIFYQMIKCANAQQKKDWFIRDIKDYNWINKHCFDAPGMDDAVEWKDCWGAYECMGMSLNEKESIYKVCNGSLLLGEVQMVQQTLDGTDAAVITPESRKYLEQVATLFGVSPDAIEEGLVVKISIAGGKEVRGRWNLANASVLKASLAKAMYDKVFDWFVTILNRTIEPEQGFSNYMGILDIFGFEVFKNNSLEQLFINVTNEKLQKNFVDVVFDRESKLYKAEGVSTGDLLFTDNSEILECLIAKNNSFFSILEEACLAPGPLDSKLLSMAYTKLEPKYPEKFQKPKVNAQEMFLIVHTVCTIEYNIAGFIEKNMDVLRPDLVEVINTSSNPVCVEMFKDVEIIKGKSAKGALIASQYLNQLNALMDVINQTEPSFIRCIKPNDCKTPLKFVNDKVLIQLFALSILEALQLKQIGFAYRRPYQEFVNQFKFIDLGAANSSADSLSKAKQILAVAKIPENQYAIGKSMIFMKSSGSKWMAKKQREKMGAWSPVISVLSALALKRALKIKYNPDAHAKISRIAALARRKINGKVAAPDPKDLGLGWYRPLGVQT